MARRGIDIDIKIKRRCFPDTYKEWEMGWSEGSFFIAEDLTPFFKADIIDIQNGKEENKISTPKFISFAKCKRKKF